MAMHVECRTRRRDAVMAFAGASHDGCYEILKTDYGGPKVSRKVRLLCMSTPKWEKSKASS